MLVQKVFSSGVSKVIIVWLTLYLNDKILRLSKLKAFADNKIKWLKNWNLLQEG